MWDHFAQNYHNTDITFIKKKNSCFRFSATENAFLLISVATYLLSWIRRKWKSSCSWYFSYYRNSSKLYFLHDCSRFIILLLNRSRFSQALWIAMLLRKSLIHVLSPCCGLLWEDVTQDIRMSRHPHSPLERFVVGRVCVCVCLLGSETDRARDFISWIKEEPVWWFLPPQAGQFHQ